MDKKNDKYINIFNILVGGGILAVIVAFALNYIFKPNQPPVSKITITKDKGFIPLKVLFDGSKSFDPDGDEINLLWTFPKGVKIKEKKTITYEFTEPGQYCIHLKAKETGWWKINKKETTDSVLIVAKEIISRPPLEIMLYSSTDCTGQPLARIHKNGSRNLGTGVADKARSIKVLSGRWILYMHVEWNEHPEIHGHGPSKSIETGVYTQEDLELWGLDRAISSVKFLDTQE